MIPPKPRIFPLPGLDRAARDDLVRLSVAHVVSAYEAVGWYVSKQARTGIGKYVKREEAKGVPREKMWATLLIEVDKFTDPDGPHPGWIRETGRAAA